MVWNKDDHNGAPLAMGTHTFPFQFHLPLDLPSSFEGTVGLVRYELYGRIATHVSKFDHVVEIAVPVMGIVDINSIPSLLRPTRIQLQKRLWSFCCRLSRVSMTVDLRRTAYCVGENIALNVSLENGSSHAVTISATLKQKVTYTAKGGRRRYNRAAVVKVTSRPIPPLVSTVWPTNLRIPSDEAPTQDFQLVNIAYSVKVIGSIPWAGRLVAKIPVIVGNVPFGEKLDWEGQQYGMETQLSGTGIYSSGTRMQSSADDVTMFPFPSTTSLLPGEGRENPHFTLPVTLSLSSSSSSSASQNSIKDDVHMPRPLSDETTPTTRPLTHTTV